MKNVTTISDLADDPSGLVRRTEAEGIVPISRSGRTVIFLVSRDKLAALLETMELQSDADLLALVKQDRAGKVKFSPVPDAI